MCVDFRCCLSVFAVFFLFKQKTAYEMRIRDWSSDVCSSDLAWLYYGGGLEMAREMFAEHDLYNLPCALIPPEASGWFRREIRSVADLRGLRMRFFGLEIGRASCRERVCQYV